MTYLILLFSFLTFICSAILLLKNKKNKQEQDAFLIDVKQQITLQIRDIREDLLTQSALSREESQRTMSLFRGEVNQQMQTILTNNKTFLSSEFDSLQRLQKERFETMDKKQNSLIKETEKHLLELRKTVEEKLQKTLNERISQSFELVRKQLESVQVGLGEMKTLAADVGGLKKVLSNVKTRGILGEVQLAALLEQILSPNQYESNVRTKPNSRDVVEFAIKLPGKDNSTPCVYLPIDAKFPKDAYEHYLNAYESGDTKQIELMSKNLEHTIISMAKDIHNKYIAPPYTTDFAILFLPFENIYAEVIRRTELIDTLYRKYKVSVNGPTTLGAMLNSLQMGFKTLAIQKRSSEVWNVLGAVKNEFGKFEGLLEKVQKNIQAAGSGLETLVGTRTRLMISKLKQVETLEEEKSNEIFPTNR